ncbi:cob(I)yrinic acid a,c-diamide adenosyltransferase [Allopusillimonas soli]|uniref:Cobalamin adenosyltransferase n=1 Tax=Allopusillimonas soli TaxID=659016 RepID=A0A853FEE5_9BURK|nr:cob(I)yrinic acid a,c-diamide adenosyltransferase [Allopusillimonas soli]NYT38068.1 cob(I)yrinic acid a,c-diamide adenosyltransferase [Allopusillimonas soli]TEA73953.1 cob(I)yrinic acid a,c-diamide adenosyltransferase [Allopusillimonas soli]
MKTRLSIIATRTGDQGTTGLGDGSRIDKDTARITALGDIDELNSAVGLLRTEGLPDDIDAVLDRIQHHLFDLGGELCIPGHEAVQTSHVLYLDEMLAHYNATLGKLEEFILPGGTRAAALAHMARTICRRAERSVVALSRNEAVRAPVRQYLNRLSDLCFVLARALNRAAGRADVFWQR